LHFFSPGKSEPARNFNSKAISFSIKLAALDAGSKGKVSVNFER